MEINELDKKIIENVRNKIVVSNLEKEENMRISKKKAIISIAAVIMIFISGSFVTVNAATEGKLVENVKGLINVTFNESKYKKVESKKGVDEQGNEYTECVIESLDGDAEYVIRNMDTEYDVDYEIKEDGNLYLEIK